MPRRLVTCLALVAALAACGDRDDATPLGGAATAQPSDSPSPSPTFSPTSTVAWTVTDAFLAPDAARQAEAGTTSADPYLGDWAVQPEAEPEPGPLLDPCGEARFPEADAVAASGERTIGWRREAAGSLLVQEVFRYGSAQAAERAFAGYADAVERCRERADTGQQSSVQLMTVSRGDADGVQRLLVRRQPCTAPGMCTAHFASYVVVAQAADGVTVATYGIVSDGDPAQAAQAVRDAVADQLGRAVRG